MNYRYIGEYGYSIIFTASDDLSTATTVVIKAKIGDISKTLTGTVSPATVFTATVPADFFDIAGVWHLQLQATYASAAIYQQGFVDLEIREAL